MLPKERDGVLKLPPQVTAQKLTKLDIGRYSEIKKINADLAKRALFVCLAWNTRFICISPVKETAFMIFTAIRLSKEWKGVTKERLFDVNSSNQNLRILKVKRDYKINMFLKKAYLFYFQNVWLLQFILNYIPTITYFHFSIDSVLAYLHCFYKEKIICFNLYINET